MKRFLLVFALVGVLLMPATSHALPELVVVLLFDNVDGDEVEDLSGFGNDGTLENGPNVVDGQFGEALE